MIDILSVIAIISTCQDFYKCLASFHLARKEYHHLLIKIENEHKKKTNSIVTVGLSRTDLRAHRGYLFPLRIQQRLRKFYLVLSPLDLHTHNLFIRINSFITNLHQQLESHAGLLGCNQGLVNICVLFIH